MSIEEKLENRACQLALERRHAKASPPKLPPLDEVLALIRILRDETHSQSIKARCVALVGEQ